MPQFHTAAVQSPSRFKDGSERAEDTKTPGVRYITGEVKDKKAREPQAYRFSRDQFTAAQAEAWLTQHKISVQAFTAAEPAVAALSRTSAIELDRSRSFRKDTLRPGRFTSQGGGVIEITPERIRAMVGAFDKMRENGVRVPIYANTHQEAYKDVHDGDPEQIAKNCIGYVGAAINDGEPLDLIYDFADDEAVKIAKRTQQVSACVEPSFTDGAGNTYADAITHVLLTPEPAVPGQGEFKEVACFSRVDGAVFLADTNASNQQVSENLNKALNDEVGFEAHAWVRDVYEDYFVYSLEDKMFKRKYTVDKKGAVTLAGNSKEVVEERKYVAVQLSRNTGEKDMDLEKLAKELGLPEGADEQACLAAVSALKARPEPPQQLARESVDGLAEATGAKFGVLVDRGKITPAASDKWTALLVGPEDKRNVYALSRALSGGDQSLASAIIAILGEEDKPVDNGAKTGAQLPEGTIALARETDGVTPEAAAKKAKDLKTGMAETASKV